MSRDKVFSPGGFLRASERYDLSTNKTLASVGIHNKAALVLHLSQYLRGIPELKQVCDAAAKYGLQAMLGGGCARVIITSYIKDAVAAGRANVSPNKSLFEMLEGSDVDVLLIKPKGQIPAQDLNALSADLNRVSGAKLVEPLPSVERRLYTAEWDVIDAREFASLNQAFGGDTSSLLGLGLDSNGELLVYDPKDALGDILAGRMRHVPGKKAYEHDMVVKGQFDPSVDGLRVIRMAGQMKEVGVEMDEGALDALKKLGDEANRRAWEVQARMLHSPGGKLERRWKKAAQKIWVDHADPGYARQLLKDSGFLELMSVLGLRQYCLHRLPEEKPDPTSASPAAQAFVRANRDKLDRWVAPMDGWTLYTWQPSQLAEVFTDKDPKTGTAPLFASDAGPAGPGLYVSTSDEQKGGIATQLLKSVAKGHTRVLDLTLADGEWKPMLAELKPAYTAQNGIEPLGEEWISRATGDVATALGVDAVKIDDTIALTHAGAITGFSTESNLQDGLLARLRSGQTGAKTEHAVRALLAMRGTHGLRELQSLIADDKVTLAQLFPAGAERGGLFVDAPFASPQFADFLEARVALAKDLTPEQQDSALYAVDYLRGSLPASLGGGARKQGAGG